MQNLYKITLCLLVALSALLPDLRAQDPRFSQYYASPWNLNPALTGVFNGKWRATANYRDQWGSIVAPVPFRTYSAAFDARFNTVRNDYASFGVGAMHDEAGTSRFEQNRMHLGGAYLKQLAGGRNKADHFLSFGAQAGFGQNSIDWNSLWFSRQFDPTTETPNTGASNGEPTQGDDTNVFFDFNAGLLWYMVFNNDGYFYAGGAMHHINQPSITLTDNDAETMYSRWTGHAGGLFPVTHNFGLQPGVLIMRQGPAFETNVGMNIRYSNNDLNELALRFGTWARLGNKLDKGTQMDAIVLVSMLEFDRWMLGLSYDVTVSALTQANNSRGAFEVSLTYFHPEQKRSRVKCPNF
ncbi:MAG: PorP/SprF family type IX secretion system membrane protein [Saprospiraceae bacterium]|nr:PorP/SprF family type IX secretion system membrane protein [Saprospiraceae bacterium]